MRIMFCFLLLVLAGCGTTGQNPGAGIAFPAQCATDPQGFNSGMSLEQDLPDRQPALTTVLGVERCVGYQLQQQRLHGVAGLTIFPGGEENTVSACVPDTARYNANAHPVARQLPSGPPTIPPPDMDCVAAATVAFPVELRFALTYRAVWAPNTSGGGLCVYRSRVDYNRFDVANLDRVDEVIRNQVREDIQRQIDFSAANELNQRSILAGASGRPLSGSDDPRCSDWQELVQ